MKSQVGQKSKIQCQIKQPIEERNKFVREAGITIQQLRLIEQFPAMRETRHKRSNLPSIEALTSLNSIQQKIICSKQQEPLSVKKQQKKNTTSSKSLKTSEKHPSKQTLSIPNSVDEFFQNYNKFSVRLFPNHSDQMEWVQQEKQNLFDLLKTTIQQGGVVDVISQGYKDQVFQVFVIKFKVKDTEEIFNIYKKYLFHFENHLVSKEHFKSYKDATLYFKQANFVSQVQLKQFIRKTPLGTKYFAYDILLFRNGQNVLDVSSNQINLDVVANYYKDYNVDIRIQKGMDYGFRPKLMRNQPYQMKLDKYRTYQKLCEQYNGKGPDIDQNFHQKLGTLKDLDVNGAPFKDRVKNNQILFAVNFDPDDGILVDHIASKVKGTFFGYKEQFDLLSYLDHQIPGCSFPQFYFKVKGVWTGGHQQNVNMCSININHGPDSSEWYTMQYKYVQNFRAQLKKEYKMDLYGNEGLWYEKINWFVEQGKYPVKRIIQKKGDIVLSGPGTLHWVRSHGIALQSAWNIFPITQSALEYAYHRQQENQKITFVRSNVIPLKKLTLKLVNHQSKLITKQIRRLCLQKLRMWLRNEQNLYSLLLDDQSYEFGEEQPKAQKLDDLEGFCQKCRQQILIYFVNGKNPQDVLCLSCLSKDQRLKRNNRTIYMRHTIFGIKRLIRLAQVGEPFPQIQQFCNGPYIGKPPVQYSKNRHATEKDQIFLQKINRMNQYLNKCDSSKLQRFHRNLQDRTKPDQNQDQHKVKQGRSQSDREGMQLQENIQKRGQRVVLQPVTRDRPVKVVNGVRYAESHPNSNGFWSFQVPQNLMKVTQQNHEQLLKLIERQVYHVRLRCRKQKREYPHYEYFINQNRNYSQRTHVDYEAANGTSNKQKEQDPQFSSDPDQEQNNQGRKKVHQHQQLQPTYNHHYVGHRGINSGIESHIRQDQCANYNSEVRTKQRKLQSQNKYGSKHKDQPRSSHSSKSKSRSISISQQSNKKERNLTKEERRSNSSQKMSKQRGEGKGKKLKQSRNWDKDFERQNDQQEHDRNHYSYPDSYDKQSDVRRAKNRQFYDNSNNKGKYRNNRYDSNEKQKSSYPRNNCSSSRYYGDDRQKSSHQPYHNDYKKQKRNFDNDYSRKNIQNKGQINSQKPQNKQIQDSNIDY